MVLFGERIKELLDRRGLTQLQLAGLMGITASRLSHYVSGRYQAKASTLVLIAKYLNTSVDYLLGRTENYSAPWDVLRPYGRDLDLSGSDGRAIRVPVYDGADPAGTPPIGNINIVYYGYAAYENTHVLIAADDSMAPDIYKGDLVVVHPQRIDPCRLKDSDTLFVVQKGDDLVARKIRRCSVDGDILIMLPANPQYPPSAGIIDENRYQLISGRAIVAIKAFRR